MLRLSMVARQQPSLFVREREGGGVFGREEWLRIIFGEDIRFEHRGGLFHYAPVQEHDAGRAIIVGRIGRQVTVAENEPPERHLADIERPAWRAARMLMDPPITTTAKVAVEYEPSVGHPVPIFESLANQINKGPEPFILEVSAIVPTDTFWNFVNLHKGQVTFIEFEFIAPNMFGEADDYDREMRDMAAQEKAQKAKLILESKDGLNLDTSKIKAAADYTTKGAGSIKAITKTRAKYNSKDRAKRINIPNKEFEATPESGLFSPLISAYILAMNRTVAYCSLLVVGAFLATVVVCKPHLLSDDNHFLLDLVGVNLLLVSGVILTITLASAGQIPPLA